MDRGGHLTPQPPRLLVEPVEDRLAIDLIVRQVRDHGHEESRGIRGRINRHHLKVLQDFVVTVARKDEVERLGDLPTELLGLATLPIYAGTVPLVIVARVHSVVFSKLRTMGAQDVAPSLVECHACSHGKKRKAQEAAFPGIESETTGGESEPGALGSARELSQTAAEAQQVSRLRRAVHDRSPRSQETMPGESSGRRVIEQLGNEKNLSAIRSTPRPCSGQGDRGWGSRPTAGIVLPWWGRNRWDSPVLKKSL